MRTKTCVYNRRVKIVHYYSFTIRAVAYVINNTLCCTRPRGITWKSVRTIFNAVRGNYYSSKIFLYVCADVSTRFYEFRMSPSTIRPHGFRRSSTTCSTTESYTMWHYMLCYTALIFVVPSEKHNTPVIVVYFTEKVSQR